MKYILVLLITLFLTSACHSIKKEKSTWQDNKSTQKREVAGTIPQDASEIEPGEFIIVTGSDYEPLYFEMSRYCDATKSFIKLYDTMGGGQAVLCVKK